jgi:hypothetical protein
MFCRLSWLETRATRARSHRFRRRRCDRVAQATVALAVIAGLWTTSAPAAFAFGSTLPCTSRDTTAAFSRWNDPSQYFLASNGGFEQGSTDWSLSAGATVVTGNEPYQVDGPTDSHSLSLAPGATAESRTACIATGEPTVRLFVDTPRVLGAILVVDAAVRNPTTGLSLHTQYLVVGGLSPGGWAPTLPIVIPNLVGGLLPEELTLRFTTAGTPATWAVDDVYIDPFKSF